MKLILSKCVVLCLCLCLAASGLWVPAALAADSATGKFVVDGKPVELKYAYAYKTFNETKDSVVILLSDAAVPPATVQDRYARKKLARTGALHYLELLIVAGKQVHYVAQHQRFGYLMEPSGDDSEHVLELKAGDAKSVVGRAHTTATQKSVDDVPYSYDVTFAAVVGPAIQP